MKSCIVTGATGYIGSHVVKHMLDYGWRVGIIVRQSSKLDLLEDVVELVDVCRYDGKIESLIDFMSRFCPDVVIHLAAAVITNPKPSDVKMLIRSNLEFGSELLEAMSQSGVKAMVNTGTFWQNYNSSDYNPVDFYAATKEAFEKIIQYYVDAHDFRVITLRLFDVYGEDDPRPKIWNQLRQHAKSGERLSLSAGDQFINLIHISDVCSAYYRACDILIETETACDSVYEIRFEKMYKLKDIVDRFMSVTGYRVPLCWGGRPYRKREVMCPMYCGPVLPGWLPQVDMMAGFTKFNIRGGVKVSSSAFISSSAQIYAKTA